MTVEMDIAPTRKDSVAKLTEWIRAFPDYMVIQESQESESMLESVAKPDFERVVESDTESVEERHNGPIVATKQRIDDLIRRIPKRIVVQTYTIAGEDFSLESSDGGFVLSHPRWSLIGEGTTLLEAEDDLIREAREILPIYQRMERSTLSNEAWAMLNFCFKVI